MEKDSSYVDYVLPLVGVRNSSNSVLQATMSEDSHFYARLMVSTSLVLAVAYHYWIHRDRLYNVHTALTLTKKWIISSQRSQCSIVDKKTQELRIKIVKSCVSVGSHLLIVGMVMMICVCIAAPASVMQDKYTNTFISVSTMGLIYYAICRVMTDTKLSSFESNWVIDVVFAIFHIGLILRVLSMSNDPGYFMLGSNRAMMRILLAVFYMDPFKSVVWNAFVSLAIVVKREANMNVLCDPDPHFATTILVSEIAILIGIFFVCASTRWVYRTCLTAQVQAEAAHSGVHHLLTVLCDAVVRVGADGKIIKPTPHFAHLLSLDLNANLEDIDFKDYLASEADQQAVNRMLKAVSNTDPGAVHVHMRRGSGLPVSVQLLFATLPDPHGKSGYLIGIREMTPMAREAEVDTPGPPKISVRKQRDFPSPSSSSSSNSSVQHKVQLKELDSIKLKFDVLSGTFAIQKCSIAFTGKSGRHGSMFSSQRRQPSLESWIHPSLWKVFTTWTQETVNATTFGSPLPPRFGPILVRWPLGDRVHLAAQAVELVVTNDDDTSDDSDSEDAFDELRENATKSAASMSETSEAGVDKWTAVLKLQGLTQLSGYNQKGLLTLLQTLRPITENLSEAETISEAED